MPPALSPDAPSNLLQNKLLRQKSSRLLAQTGIRLHAATMQPKHTVTPLVSTSDYTPEAWSLLLAELSRATGLDRATVRKGLLGERVRISTRLTLQRALKDLHAEGTAA